MATLVFFHAHPDDESIGTGGSIAKASAEGHRVVVVVATRGELGAEPKGLLLDGEELGQRRVTETERAVDILGAHRLAFLGYRDSGMMGSPTNGDAGSFWSAEVDEAAQRLAAILIEEVADVLVVYDKTGVTGHPDHIQVHRVGHRAAERAGTPEVVEATMSHSQAAILIRHAVATGAGTGTGTGNGHSTATGAVGARPVEPATFGTPDDKLTGRVDVRAYLDLKRRAMAAHASQISETSFFLTLPPDAFEAVWGYECLVRGTFSSFRRNESTLLHD